MNPMKDPNMQEAANKILAILKEHDLMGVAFMAGKERSGYILEISPSWSCAALDENGESIRVKAKIEEYKSADAMHECVRTTVQGIMGILHVATPTLQSMQRIIQYIGQKVNISFVAHDHTSATRKLQ